MQDSTPSRSEHGHGEPLQQQTAQSRNVGHNLLSQKQQGKAGYFAALYKLNSKEVVQLEEQFTGYLATGQEEDLVQKLQAASQEHFH